MKITEVTFNNRRKVFTIQTSTGTFDFPYSKCSPVPTRGNYVRKAYPDKELGKEAFTYIVESGEEGTIHIDSVLEENEDPETMKELLIYNLTLALQEQLKESPLSRREIIRKMETSPSHFYRIIEPSNTSKSIDQILKLFYSLNCDIEMAITPRGLKRTDAINKKKTLRVSSGQLRSPRKRMKAKPHLSH